MSDQRDQGFTVRDRRTLSQDREEAPSEEGPSKTMEEGPKEEVRAGRETQRDIPLPEPSFSAFLTFFFFQQTLMFLGDFPHPETQQAEKNLPMAKYLIDTLGIIKQKTAGNLNSEEESQLNELLTELRMRYVKVAGK